MRVGLVTNWGDHCSIAEYAKNLTEYLPSDIQVTIVPKPFTVDDILSRVQDVDIIHFNYIAYHMDHSVIDGVCRGKKSIQKTLITYHETPDGNLFQDNALVDAIVLHEPQWENVSKVHLIPNGIRLVNTDDIKRTPKLGSAGFAYKHKRFDLVVDAAKALGLECLLLTPKADCWDEPSKYDSVEVVTDYLPYDDVIRRLAECFITVFPYDENYPNIGIGNAVRFGLASGNSVIVTNHHHFRDLNMYKDEIYFVETNVIDTVKLVQQDIAEGKQKIPTKLLSDMSWEASASKYVDLYNTLLQG
jgi:glycosyltransferase involved in cell wall biosynthesis